MLFSVLKRKCGWSCILSASSRALASRVFICEAFSSRSRERREYVKSQVAPTIPANVRTCVGNTTGRSVFSVASWTATTHGKPISSG